jgi:ribosomal protein L11 methyltransferase
MRTWPALEVGRLVETGDGRLELFQAALLDYDVAAIDEAAADTWRVFFQTPSARDTAARGLAPQFPELTLQAVEIPDDDWAARSQAALRSVEVGHIVVAPPWDVPTPAAPESRTVIVIQPSMGFGTGHHASTRLCLAALQQIDVGGRRVLDVGTGSGVLAIAASRLGAADVVAIDDDADAIRAARENLALNPGGRVQFQLMDVRSSGLSPCDIVIANLTGGLLRQAAGRLHDLTAASGRLILGGFLAHEEAEVRAAHSALALAARSQEDEWICITLERTS